MLKKEDKQIGKCPAGTPTFGKEYRQYILRHLYLFPCYKLAKIFYSMQTLARDQHKQSDPDEQLQLIVMAISHATACFSYWTIAGIPDFKISVTFLWRISQARRKWQWKIVYYDDINYIKNHGFEDKSFIHNHNFHAIASLFISLHSMSVFTFIHLALQLLAA